ncbi:S-adenosyl-L-methionine-dependent methyltransferase [Leucosporidium creatinivorum]|uniref:S-adenosyl-L-methionine-dependent methyltransferase n=1 Tax=Leucosporidium creatinivorum TaxID=106004 RepID=A0A1Y2FQB1_9BASI|nr:S-adenosyl-L-methionine-dependent methyltransferase [Leucosporidium creatinivorum]
MKLKELESELQPLKGFAAPKRELEQYVTSPHLAARMIYTAATAFDDIEEKDVLDMGCGCAVLSIASVMMGASSVLSVDMDPDALAIARENVASVEMEDEVSFLHRQIAASAETATSKEVDLFTPHAPELTEEIEEENEDGEVEKRSRKIDTVVMNPPFGSWNKGIDMVFLETACEIAHSAVYSLNKSSTRDFIERKAKQFGFEGEVIAEMRYDLPKTMAFHKKATVDIQVDMWRFVRVSGEPV